MTTTDRPHRGRDPRGAPHDGPTRPNRIVSSPNRNQDDGEPHTPVFVDRTGRRRRILVTAGIGGTVALGTAAAGLVLALTGATGQALPGLPAPAAHAHTPAAPRAASSTTTRGAAAPTSPAKHTGTTASVPSPTPQPTTAANSTPTPSPSGTSHRHVPTQTPSHSKKK